MRLIQIEYQADWLHIDNVADFATRKQRLKDFLRVWEEFFITNFGSTLLLIGWVHVQYSIHLINVKVGPVCVVGKKCSEKMQLLEAIGCLLPLLKNLMGQYNINKLNTVTKSVLKDFMCEDNPPLHSIPQRSPVNNRWKVWKCPYVYEAFKEATVLQI